MLQRRKKLRVACRDGFVILSLMLALAPTASLAQGRPPAYDSPVATAAEQLPAQRSIPVDLRTQFETSSVIAAALSFAVGFGACLLIVHNMLPALVQSQCIEIVRDYLERVPRESDIRVVVVDRESEASLSRPRRASNPETQTNAESSHDLQPYLRVDQPPAPAGSADGHGVDAASSVLSQIYEQNLHLRDQLRKQSRSIKE